MSTKTIFVRTDDTGAFTYERPFQGVIHAIEVKLGSGATALSTPDIDITDDTYSLSILSVDGVAADTVYRPGQFLGAAAGTDLVAGADIKAGTPAVCLGALKVVVAGGGDTKRGTIRVLYS